MNYNKFNINIVVMDTVHEVVIIGAGASGIGAAYTLTKLGIPYLML